MRTQMFIRLDSRLKENIRKLAKAEHRDMNSYVVVLFEEKIRELKNGK